MLLIVSTLEQKGNEKWFFQSLLQYALEKFPAVLAFGYPTEFSSPSNNIYVGQYFWDIGRLAADWLPGYPCDELDMKSADTDQKWGRCLIALRGQSEPCYLQPLQTIRRYRARCQYLLDTICPQAILLSNPAVPHTGIFVELAQQQGIPIMTFERSIVKGHFEFDPIGSGPNNRVSRMSKEQKQALMIEFSAHNPAKSTVDISVNSRSASLGEFLVGELPSLSEDCIGVLGIDDTTTGVVYCLPTGEEHLLNFASSSVDLAISLAQHTYRSVIFKPHPSSFHLVGGRNLPDNLSIFGGDLLQFISLVPTCVGLGSTADLSFLATNKPYVLAGTCFLKHTGLVPEAETPQEILEQLNQVTPQDRNTSIGNFAVFSSEKIGVSELKLERIKEIFAGLLIQASSELLQEKTVESLSFLSSLGPQPISPRNHPYQRGLAYLKRIYRQIRRAYTLLKK